MKLRLLAFWLLFPFTFFAQVGIGTSTPNAELEIKSPSDNLPALELNPQTAPDGTAMGQISVINTADYGPELFMFDTTRATGGGLGKWLSVASSSFTFGREGSLNNASLEYAGDITASGPRIPRDATIVYVAFNSSGGNTTKGVRLTVHSASGSLLSTTDFNLVGGSFTKTDFNLDLNAGDYVRAHVQNDGGTNVNDVSAVVWIKWRK